MLKPKPYKLKNTIQHYEWGTKGKNAFIPKLLNIKAVNGKPYAELWMGAHPKASSKTVVGGKEIDLLKAIKKYPDEMLGRKTTKSFSNTLPFLFKVLSVKEALSIQAHPSKGQAIVLHKKDPVNYPDPYHKLEIAIALDSLTALVGFKPFNQIIKTLKEYPEIHDFIGEIDWSVTEKKKFVKKIFTRLLKKSVSDEKFLTTTIRKLKNRLSEKKNQTEIENYFLELSRKYKNDVGLLIIFFLNLVHLQRGEAIFTQPGVPHAYLKGNILECMSNSDNVIRAGLTPKHKDIDSLLKVLTYELNMPKIIKGKKKVSSIIYQTDANEFETQIFTINKNELNFKNQDGPKILLVIEGAIKFLLLGGTKGKSEKIKKGKSVFLPSILSNFRIASEKNSRVVLVSVPA